MLILPGGRDYQVTLQDLSGSWWRSLGGPQCRDPRIAEPQPSVYGRRGKRRPEEYDRPSHVDGEVIDAIAIFVTGIPAK